MGFTPKGVSYVLYKMDAAKKYRSFDIPKKSGGTRAINAPEPQLALLQSRLAALLYACVQERKKTNPRFWFASHGFHQGRTIVSNAEVHKRRRFVFNLDLKDFFGTINFGRVRGFFINDQMFSLEPKVATIIAQIACHDNTLPQGSPCSPVISNLIGNILDSRLLALARDAHCTYTRYADDLTFSTNEKLFPTEIAVNVHGAEWQVGTKLGKTIETTGFSINPTKTRMSLRRSRQTVTGLVVNDKANINQDYYRAARAMCHSLFKTGYYFKPGDDATSGTDNLNPLEGTLSHIYFVKARRDRKPKINKMSKAAGEFSTPHAPEDLYRKFLFYKYFAAPKAPLIVTEGISDITYLHCAIRAMAKKFPLLAEEKDGKIARRVQFLKPSGTSRDILNLGHGAAGQASLISSYSNNLKPYAHKPMANPVIILCDNDDGPKTVFKSAAKKQSGVSISTTTTDPFYYLGENLYLVKVPEGATPHPREIENLFQPALLAIKLNGKSFDPRKDHGDDTHYGKVAFAESVVRPNASTVDFSGFEDFLKRIEDVLKHYADIFAATAAAPPASPAVAAGGSGTP
ncbi:retron Ec67 family RNA-directed DNA polymerase/endonuclease [Paracoccus sp. TOH]|uniref:retron Ec67 family RNA-directed DNA polymerase/endonuclease n=1 Tax=Paracoccus sp. TOH TaxID=1263728 RepID=UPI0025B0CBE3|nr:retron Ec67 family RNA-directed DNA polymerase/endonuclease [Paracoccus sp. TOH]WJS84162.1 retron Ec67 family RNA-directed DNA polymerase/endonuclease [Paracoccus sp. TOH]